MSEIKNILKHPEDISKLDIEALDIEIEKGYQDMLTGRVMSAKQAFENIRKSYSLDTCDAKLRNER